MAKYHSNSAYPPKFLVEFEAKYLPQIAPEAVSEHEYVKISWGGMPPDPPRGAWIFIKFWICHCTTPPKSKCLDPPLFMISVMRNDVEHPISAIQHYKLLITRQEVYEIEGTEQSFTDISGLLQFYQETPLTISSRTIGKVCPKPENYLIT